MSLPSTTEGAMLFIFDVIARVWAWFIIASRSLNSLETRGFDVKFDMVVSMSIHGSIKPLDSTDVIGATTRLA